MTATIRGLLANRFDVLFHLDEASAFELLDAPYIWPRRNKFES